MSRQGFDEPNAKNMLPFMCAAQAFVLLLSQPAPVTLATPRTTRVLAYVDPFADPVFNLPAAEAANHVVAHHEAISTASTVASRNQLVRSIRPFEIPQYHPIALIINPGNAAMGESLIVAEILCVCSR